MDLNETNIVSRHKLIVFIITVTLATLYFLTSAIPLQSISSSTDSNLSLASSTHVQEQPNLTSSTHIQEQPNCTSSTHLQEQPNLASSTLLQEQPNLASSTHLQEQPNLASSPLLQEQQNLASSTHLQEQPNLASSTLLQEQRNLSSSTLLQEQRNLASSTLLQEQRNLASSTFLQEHPNFASSSLLRDSTLEAFKEISDRNRERKAKIEEYCDYLKKTDQLDKVRLYPTNVTNGFFISRNYKLIWKVIYKCGYNTWKSHFKTLGRRDRNVCLNCTHDAILDAWQRLQDDDYVSFVFVRHPFMRLISAYRNKLNDSMHNWELVRGNITRETSEFSKLSKNIARKYGNGDGQRLCTFKEFVTYIVEGNGTDPHWNPISQMVFPCDLKYTVIGKMETFEEDTEYILKLKNITHINSSKQLNKNNPTSIDPYFSTLSKKLMQGLYLKYQVDIEMFDYNIDAFTKYM